MILEFGICESEVISRTYIHIEEPDNQNQYKVFSYLIKNQIKIRSFWYQYIKIYPFWGNTCKWMIHFINCFPLVDNN